MEANIEVAIRVRPLLDKELDEGLPVHWQINGQNIFQIGEQGKASPQSFKFDHIFGGERNNSEIFRTVVQPMIRSGMGGYNATVFSYGQTASGKTYTMLGSHRDPGIIPLTINDIFDSINSNVERKFLLRLSYIEIYNDVIYDLLDTTTKTIKIREDTSGVIHLNVEEKIIHTAEQAQAVLKQGDKQRRYGATYANQRSSRSHTIFRIIIESTPLSDDPDSDLPVHVSHLNLVDLAGSERPSQSKATGARLREGGQINKSLHLLSLVIRQLSEGKDFTNFRDSKLTRILKESLGGNAKTLIIGAITPTSIDDSQSTLNFTCQAKKIKNKPTINEVLDSETLTKQYIQKEKELRKQLAEMVKDKKELEEKHVVTVRELTDKLYHFGHQFIIGSNRTPVKEEALRRHTIGPSNIKKTVKQLKYPSKYGTVQRNPKARRLAVPPLQDTAAGSSSSQAKVLNISPLQRHVLHFNQAAASNLQAEVKKIESQISVDFRQAASRWQETFNKKSEAPGATPCKALNAVVFPVMEERELKLRSSSGEVLPTTPTPMNTAVLNIKEREPCEQGLPQNFNSKELIKENELLKEQINNLNEKLKIAHQTNTTVKLKLEETAKMLEKTEDELLGINEQLDHEENENDKLQRAIKGMMSKMTYKINELKDNDGGLHLKDVLDDMVKSNEDLQQYLPLDSTHEEQKHSVVEDEVKSNRADLSLQQNEFQGLTSISGLLCNLKSILSSDHKAEKQEKLVAELQHGLNEGNNEQNSFKNRCEELKGEVQEHEKLNNDQYQANFDKEHEKHSKEVGLLEAVINVQHQESEDFIENIKVLESKLALQIELTANAARENSVRDKGECAKQTKQMDALYNELIQQQQLNVELIKQKIIFENKMQKYLEQEKLMVKLTSENKCIEEKFKQREILYADLLQKQELLESGTTKQGAKVLGQKATEQDRVHRELDNEKQPVACKNAELTIKNNSLQAELDCKERLNTKFAYDVRLLEENIMDHGEESSKLFGTISALKGTVTEQKALINKYVEEIDLFSRDNAKLAKEKKNVGETLALQLEINAQAAQERQVLQNTVTKDVHENAKCSAELTNENDALRDELVHQERLNVELTKEKRLLEDKVGQYLRQEQEMAKLVEESATVREKLAQTEKLMADLSKNKQLLDDDLIRQKQLLEDKAGQHLTQEEEMTKLVEESAIVREKLAQQEELIADLSKNKQLLDDDLIRQKQINAELIKEKSLFEDKAGQHLMQEQEMAKLVEENATVREKLAQQEELIADRSKNKQLLDDDLIRQKQLNAELIKEKSLLEDKAGQYLIQEQEMAKLVEENATVREKLAQQEELIADLSKNKQLLDDDFIRQKQLNAELIKQKSLLENKIGQHLMQREEMAKLVEENAIAREKLAQKEELIADLSKNKQLLDDDLIRKKQLNAELIKQKSLLENKIGQHLMQREEMAKLVEENATVREKLAQQEELIADLSKNKQLLDDDFIRQKQLNAELIKQKSLLENKIGQHLMQREEMAKLVEENAIAREKLAQKEELIADLSKNKQLLDDDLIRKKQLNAELIKQKSLLENKIGQHLMQREEMAKLVEENATVREKLAQQEELIADRSKNKQLLDDDLIRQKQLNAELIKEKSLLENKIGQHLMQREEMAKLVEENAIAREKLAQKEELIADLSKNKQLLDDDLIRKKQLNAELIKQKSLLENKIGQHLMQREEMAKLVEENAIAREKLAEKEELIADLNKNKQVLDDNLNRRKQLNAKLIKEKSLLDAKLAQFVKQQQEMVRLSQENSILREKQINVKLEKEKVELEEKIATYQEQAEEIVNPAQVKLAKDQLTEKFIILKNQLTAQFSAETELLKNNVIKQKQLNIDLTNRISTAQKQIMEQDEIISRYCDLMEDTNFDFSPPQGKVKSTDSQGQEKLVEENNILRAKCAAQEKVIAELKKKISWFLKQSADLASLTEKSKSLIISTMDIPNLAESSDSREDINILLDSNEYKQQWQLCIKQLYDTIKTKNEEVEFLDKDIIDTVSHVKSLEKTILEQTQQIAKLKEQQMVKVKTQEMSITELKKRRSLSQDSSRKLNEEEDEPLLCTSCKVTNLISLNNALLRETQRKTMNIAKLEKAVHNLRLTFNVQEEEHESLKNKYKQMKEVAVMRRIQLKKLEVLKIDCETQT